HRVALDRWRAREQRADRPGQQPARCVLLGPCPQLANPGSGHEARHGQARLVGGGRPLPIGHCGHGRHARQGRRPQPQPCCVPLACCDPVRDQRFLHR
ncbi:Uncharacterized protein APZ42_003149, partial [Daphnia magna]